MTDYLYTGAGSYSDIYSTALGYSTSISVPPGSFSLRFNSAGTIFYTTGIGIDELTAVDAATSAIIGSVTIGASKSGLAISNSGLIAYTSDPSAHQLSVIDLTSLTVVTTIPVGSGFGSVSGMCFDPSDTYVYAYLSDSVSSALLKIDVSSSTIAATIPMTPYAYFANGGDVVITPGGATLFVLTQDASRANFAEMTIVDVSSFTVTTTVVATFDCNYSYGIGIGNFCKSIFINDAGTTIYVFGIAGGTSGLI
jgi:DNA-binding beta-propeller fold protein YncE